jgi:hypothetical protein
MSPKYIVMKNGKNRIANVKQFVKETRFNIHIRNLVEACMVVTEDNITITDIAMNFSAFLQTTKEGERVLPV